MAEVEQWKPSSWRAKDTKHQPPWPTEGMDTANKAVQGTTPPVTKAEVDSLHAALKDPQALIIQAGPCAESFDATQLEVERTVQTIEAMGQAVSAGSSRTPVLISRLAGQFAKPRSSQTEEVDGQVVNSFFGHAVNDAPLEDRLPNPNRLVEAAAVSRNVREQIREVRDDMFTSHEALLLDYEENQCAHDSDDGWYSLSAHALWLGERTRQLDGGHVEFLRGVANPLMCKIGPAATPEDVQQLALRLNPDRVPSRLHFVARFGASPAYDKMRVMLEATNDVERWVCDPMHGNTVTVDGLKTRRVEAILSEVEGFMAAHSDTGSTVGGIHLEMTGEDVTECTSNGQSPTSGRYETLCDPRLNPTQGLAVVQRFVELVGEMERV